jgi:Cadherin domain
VTIEIEARDKGSPSKSSLVRMDVEITQTINAYPQWSEDYSLVPARISENAPVNTIVKRLRATSSIPDSLVNYIIQPGEVPEQNGQPRSFYFRIDDQTNEMILLTYRPLDYEALPQYMLTIKAAVGASRFHSIAMWNWK